MLVVVTVTDLEQRIIPNKVLAAGAVAALGIAAISDPSSIPDRLIAAAGRRAASSFWSLSHTPAAWEWAMQSSLR